MIGGPLLRVRPEIPPKQTPHLGGPGGRRGAAGALGGALRAVFVEREFEIKKNFTRRPESTLARVYTGCAKNWKSRERLSVERVRCENSDRAPKIFTRRQKKLLLFFLFSWDDSERIHVV